MRSLIITGGESISIPFYELIFVYDLMLRFCKVNKKLCQQIPLHVLPLKRIGNPDGDHRWIKAGSIQILDAKSNFLLISCTGNMLYFMLVRLDKSCQQKNEHTKKYCQTEREKMNK